MDPSGGEQQDVSSAGTAAAPPPALPSFRWALGGFFISTALVLVLGSLSQALNITVGLIFTELALILAPPLVIARLKGFDFIETFSLRRPALPDLALALAVGCAGWLLAVQGTAWLTDAFGVDNRTLPALRAADPGLVVAMAVFPPCEEILFRGLVFAGLRTRYRPIHAMLLTAFLFGIYHQDPTRHLAATFIGAMYGACLLRSGSIAVPMLAHFTNNLCAGLLSRGPLGVDAQPWWALLAAAAVLAGGLYLMGRGRARPAFADPSAARKPLRFYLVAVLMTAGTVVSLSTFLDLMIWQDVLLRNGTVQFDRYRMRDDYWYRKESTIVLWGDGVAQWTDAGTTLSIPRGDGFISASIGGHELPYTLRPESRVALTLPDPAAPGTVLEVVCKGRFRPGQPHRFPSHPFVPAIGLRATIDLREAPGLRFDDSDFRVKTPMFLTYPKVADYSQDGGWVEAQLLER